MWTHEVFIMEYKPVTASLERKADSFTAAKDFDPARSDSIITQLLSEMKECELVRNPKIVTNRENGRIMSASLWTTPSMVHCKVDYLPLDGSHGGLIRAELNFISDDPFDVSEYEHLKKIVYTYLRD